MWIEEWDRYLPFCRGILKLLCIDESLFGSADHSLDILDYSSIEAKDKSTEKCSEDKEITMWSGQNKPESSVLSYYWDRNSRIIMTIEVKVQLLVILSKSLYSIIVNIYCIYKGTLPHTFQKYNSWKNSLWAICKEE